MTIHKMTIKSLGKKYTFFRVLDKSGEPVRIFETEQEAKDYLNGL